MRRPYQLVTPDGRLRSFATCERATTAAGIDSGTWGAGMYLVQRREGRNRLPVVLVWAADGRVERRQRWTQLHAQSWTHQGALSGA